MKAKVYGAEGYAAFARGVAERLGLECWPARILKARDEVMPSGLLRCDGIMDFHHLVPKRVLRRECGSGGMDARLGTLLVDWRNGVPTCRRHHDLIESFAIRLVRAELPALAESFAAELGLGWWLDRTYGQISEAA